MIQDLSSPPLPPRTSDAATSGVRVDELGAARVGHVLKGKWRLDAVLGSGATATVYTATHRNGNRVAVKLLHPCFSTMGAERDRFSREGYLANQVDHPDAVRVLDEDVDEEGNLFLVMDLVEGEPLVARWKAAGYHLPVVEALWIADRLLGVLEAVHARGIVHRDIKPENLFLTAAGGLKVLDFGIARLGRAGSGTMRGLVLGTPGFAAPEQARGDIVDARTDIWAVGATLFALLTGRLVHEEPTTAAHLLRVSFEPVPPVHQIEPNLPDVVARLIDRALSFNQKDRFESDEEMRRAIATAFRLITGQPLTAKLPAGVIGIAGSAPTLRVTTGTAAVFPSSNPRLSRPVDRRNAAAMAMVCFALGAIMAGYFASGHTSAADSVREATLVTPPALLATAATSIAGESGPVENAAAMAPLAWSVHAVAPAAPIPTGARLSARSFAGLESRASAAVRALAATSPSSSLPPSPPSMPPSKRLQRPVAVADDRFDFLDTRH